MIIALAGRRIDARDSASRRFPPENITMVRERLGMLFKAQQAEVLISSAACGADLLALEEAGAQGMRRRIVLPFSAERFRTTSVIDRPGDWGSIYDRIIAEARLKSDLLTLEFDADEEDHAFEAANRAILNEAAVFSQSSGTSAAAVLVWEGRSRGGTDLTEAFGEEARRRRLAVLDVMTL